MTTATEALAWLQSKLVGQGHANATYHRGATSMTLSQCVDGSTAREQAESDGAVTRVRSTDFILARGDFATLGLPEAGDSIQVVRGGGLHIYDVLPRGDEPCFRTVHEAGAMLRVHATLREVQP